MKASEWNGQWTVFDSQYDNVPKARHGNINDLKVDVFLPRGTGKDGKKINFALYLTDRNRKKENISFSHGVIFDFDYASKKDIELLQKLNFFWLAHYSYSAKIPEIIKFRLLIPFQAPVNAKCTEFIWDWFAAVFKQKGFSEPDILCRQRNAIFNTVRENQAHKEVLEPGKPRAIFNENSESINNWVRAKIDEEIEEERRRRAIQKEMLEKLKGTEVSQTAADNYVKTAFSEIIQTVSQLPPGQRNANLNREAFKAGTLVGAGVLSEDAARLALIDAAIASGHDTKNARATVDSGFKAGMKNPRDLSTVGRINNAEHKPAQPDPITPEEIEPEKPIFPHFILEESGVYVVEADNNGKPKVPQLICSPLRVLASSRDSSGSNWGRLLELRDRDGRWKSWAMPMEFTANDGTEYRRILLQMGLEIYAGKKGQKYLSEYISKASPAKKVICTQKTGWFRDCFVLPDKVIGNDDDSNEQVLFQSVITGSVFEEQGSIEDWKNTVGQLCKGNSRLVFSVCVGLASALLDICKMDSGGFHFRGGSSTGKSTALRVAASVFGSSHYIRQWRATDNALEAIAAMQNDALLILDEIGQVKADQVGQIAYMLANGCSKARANRYANGTRDILHWRLFFLSSGEIGLSDHMNSVGQTAQAGMEMRLLEIPADAGAGHGMFEDIHGSSGGAEFADRLKIEADKNFGIIFPAWLKKLVENKESLYDLITGSKKQLCDMIRPQNCSGQIERAMGRFALIAVAGELATEWGLTGWDKLEATKAVVKCFNDWIALRGTTGQSEEMSILSKIRLFFQLHGASRFQDWNNPEWSNPANRAGFKRTNITTGEVEFYVFPDVFTQEICRGFDPGEAIKLLKAAGLLISNTDKSTSVGRIPGFPGAKRFYHITAGIISDDDYG